MIPSVSAAMIVCNEADNLAGCLESIKDWVDEIVIVDTGSVDNTKQIARQFTDKVYDFVWNDDFSAARNFAVEKTSGEWILSIDADERLDCSKKDIKGILNTELRELYDAFLLPIYSITEKYVQDIQQYIVLRLFRKRTGRFIGPIHEQIAVMNPKRVKILEAPVLWHQTVSIKERNKKRNRNITYIKKALLSDLDNPFLKYYLGVEWLGLGNFNSALSCFNEVCRNLTAENMLFLAPAMRNLMSCLVLLKRHKEAFVFCMEQVALYPQYTDLYYDGALIMEELGEYDIAVRWFKCAVDLGLPPAVFSHTTGTESFLSYYHLGYCCEKLGCYKQAKIYYDRALSANYKFVYPIYQLFLRLLLETNAEEAFDYFENVGYLNNPSCADALAEVCFDFYLPSLAHKCFLYKINLDGALRELDIKHLIYGGYVKEARTLFDKFKSEDMAVYEIVGLMLEQQYSLARKKVFDLWKISDKRSQAWALLNLVSMCEKGKMSGIPEAHRTKAVTRTLLSILENLLRVPLGATHIVEKIIEIIKRMSAQSNIMLYDYYQIKVNTLLGVLNLQYPQARGLYI